MRNTGYGSIRSGGHGRNCSGRRNWLARNRLMKYSGRLESKHYNRGDFLLDDMSLRGAYDPDRISVNG